MPETCESSFNLSAKRIIRQYGFGLTNWQFMKPTLTLALLFAAMNAWITAGPFLVMDLFHYSPVIYGLLQGAVFSSFILGTRLLSRIIEKTPLSTIKKMSITLAFLGGILSLILCLLVPNYLFAILFPMMIIALGAGIGFPVFNRLAIESSNEPMGIKMALFPSFLGMGGFLGSMMISSFYTGTTLGFSFIIFGITGVILLIHLIHGSPQHE